MTWLITGGAGFIGSHVVKAMTDGGESVLVLDDLSTGSAERLPAGVPLVAGSVLDGELVGRVLAEHAITGVVHIAGKKQVAESVEKPCSTTARTSRVCGFSLRRRPRQASAGSSSPRRRPSTACPTSTW